MSEPELKLVARRIRSFPDFPIPGVLFRCGHEPARRRVGAVLSSPGAGAWAASGILPGLCLATRGSLSCPCSQGYLAPLERPGLLPSFHPPPGQSPEVHAQRQDRLHRRRVALLGRARTPRSYPLSPFPLLSPTVYPTPIHYSTSDFLLGSSLPWTLVHPDDLCRSLPTLLGALRHLPSVLAPRVELCSVLVSRTRPSSFRAQSWPAS